MPAVTDSLAASSLADTLLASDSTALDSAGLDSVAAPVLWGVTLEAPPAAPAMLPERTDGGASWALMVLMVIFCVAAVKLRSSPRFLATLFSDLLSVRERHSIFDVTVRETSLLVVLCLLTTVSGGVMLGAAASAVGVLEGSPPPLAAWLPWMSPQLAMMVLSTLLWGAYMLLLWFGYNLSGFVFYDRAHTVSWVQAFSASMGLLSLVWLPCALLCVCRPDWTLQVICVAAGLFLLAKLAFIWKGMRIFLTKGSSWLLFLYYLCSLEAVPLFIVVSAAVGSPLPASAFAPLFRM